MSSKRRAKWEVINRRVKKHLATLEIQDNETENSFQRNKEPQFDNQTVTESIKSKYLLNSDVLKHCQHFEEYERIENVDNNIFDCANNASEKKRITKTNETNENK